MPTQASWNAASQPNYGTNDDLKYPYSDLPFLIARLVKLAAPVDLVDFWGEGRVVEDGKTSGFEGAYNVNHQYQLVSNGADKGRRIPNRIPTQSYGNPGQPAIDLSGYVDDDAVTNVTLMGAPIVASCASEIARIVRKDVGRVILYGFSPGDADVATLDAKLAAKNFYRCPGAKEDLLPRVTLFDSAPLVYFNAAEFGVRALPAIRDGEYGQARELIAVLNAHGEKVIIGRVMANANSSYRAFPLAYELAKYPADTTLARGLLPDGVAAVVAGRPVVLTNKQFSMPLKVGWTADGEGDRRAYGGDSGRGIEKGNENRFQWKFAPIDGGDFFTITNLRFDMPLKLEWNADGTDDRGAFGGDAGRGVEAGNTDRFHWQVSPVVVDGRTYFTLTNRRFSMPLKLGWAADGEGDRSAYGGSSTRDVEAGNEGRFYWSIEEARP